MRQALDGACRVEESRILIVGLGLIGGSLAAALRASGYGRCDSDAAGGVGPTGGAGR